MAGRRELQDARPRLVLCKVRAGGARHAVPVKHAEEGLLGVVGKPPVRADRILVRLVERLWV